MITKEQLQGMANYEISLALCDLLGYKVDFIHPRHESEFPTINVSSETLGQWFAVEFGRWDCIMPLAIEYKLSLIENDVGYTAYQNFSIYEDINYRIEHGAYFGDTNPLRATACCLILVLQEKKL